MSQEKPLGRVIRDVLDKSGMKISIFADRIGTTRQNAYKIFEKHSIPTARLKKISEVLSYDFFQHMRLEQPLSRELADAQSNPNLRYADIAKELESARERIRMLEQRLKDKEDIIELLRAAMSVRNREES